MQEKRRKGKIKYKPSTNPEVTRLKIAILSAIKDALEDNHPEKEAVREALESNENRLERQKPVVH